MDITYISPLVLRKDFLPSGMATGLTVRHYIGKNNSNLTSFEARFTLPGNDKIPKKYFDTIYHKFHKYFIDNKYKKDVFYVKNIDGFAIVVNIGKYLSKEESFKLICDICKYIMALPITALAYHDKIKEIISWYLDLITTGGKFYYKEQDDETEVWLMQVEKF